jgi:hypothetical protein
MEELHRFIRSGEDPAVAQPHAAPGRSPDL